VCVYQVNVRMCVVVCVYHTCVCLSVLAARHFPAFVCACVRVHVCVRVCAFVARASWHVPINTGLCPQKEPYKNNTFQLVRVSGWAI